MAAIICDSISKLCKGTCECFGRILCAPCRICGMTCEFTKDVICTPFFCYLAVVSFIMVPPMCYAVTALAEGNGIGCKLFTWLIVNAVFCFINIAAAFHISKTILKEEDVEAGAEYQLDNGKSLQATNPGSSSRIQYVLCYDPVTAMYLLVKGIFVIWQFLGVSWAISGDGCDSSLANYTFYSASCGFTYISVAGCMLACSLCCVREHGEYVLWTEANDNVCSSCP